MTLRRLRQTDHAVVMDYVLRERELNLFIIGDIENYGYDTVEVEHWGQLDDQGRLRAILTRYFDSLIFYSREDFNLEGFLDLFDRFEYRMLLGERGIIAPFAQRLAVTDRKDDHFCRLHGNPRVDGDLPLERVRLLNHHHTADIVRLLETIREFQPPDGREIRQRLKSGSSRAYGIEEDGRVIAIAQTSAETNSLAMIVGVATHPAHRRQGYASACMARLCQDLFAEGKTLCLFYENPEAGRIYHNLGFEDIGEWTMLFRR